MNFHGGDSVAMAKSKLKYRDYQLSSDLNNWFHGFGSYDIWQNATCVSFLYLRLTS